MFTKYNIEFPQKESDPRIGSFLNDQNEKTKAAILGFPCDIGVTRNNGRAGAAKAPLEIRKQLYRLSPDPRYYENYVSLLKQTVDFGDLEIFESLEESQSLLGTETGSLLDHNIVPIIIGGGHETSYGHFLGYVNSKKAVSIINIDAHTDVRPLVDGKGHSGSPFRQALEHKSRFCKSYYLLGASPWAISKDQVEFIKSHSGEIVWYENTSTKAIDAAINKVNTDIMFTMDIDVINRAFAPGVSARTASGFLDPDTWLYAAYAAGKSSKVKSFDIVETNPRLDIESYTSQLAALTIWYFLLGLCQR